MNLRNRALDLINAGNATRETLATELNITRRHLSTIFAQLRLQGNYPFTFDGTDNGILILDTKESWEATQAAMKADREARAALKTKAFKTVLAARSAKWSAVAKDLDLKLFELTEKRAELKASGYNLTEINLMIKLASAKCALASYRAAKNAE